VILLGVNSNIGALMFCQEEGNQTAIPEAPNTAAISSFFDIELTVDSLRLSPARGCFKSLLKKPRSSSSGAFPVQAELLHDIGICKKKPPCREIIFPRSQVRYKIAAYSPIQALLRSGHRIARPSSESAHRYLTPFLYLETLP
jgi:hypothetical protein